ncbi:MAG: HEAT repeat domain-containing protein [Gloeotrichia echinulata IR180]
MEFNDGCGEWNRKDIDKGFYDYRAYFLAAAGIVEFKHCSRTDEIVEQIVKWGFGYFNTNQHKWVTFLYVIVNEAKTALQETERTKAIAALVQLLQSQDVDDSTRRRAAYSLEKIGTGNENAIAALVQLLQSQDVDDYTRRRAAYSLGKIDPGNENAIAALVQLLQSQDVDEETRRRAADSLGEILQSNKQRSLAVKALKGYLQFDDNYNVIWQCAQNMPYPDFYNAWHDG